MRRFGTAGECLGFDCSLHWVGELITEGRRESFGPSTVGRLLTCPSSRGCAFQTPGGTPSSRRLERDGEVVVENACTSGLDLSLLRSERPSSRSAGGRPRETVRRTGAAVALPSARPRGAAAVSGSLVGRHARPCSPPRICLRQRRLDSSAWLRRAGSDARRSSSRVGRGRGDRRQPRRRGRHERLGARRADAGRRTAPAVRCRTAATRRRWPVALAALPRSLVVLERGERSPHTPPVNSAAAARALVTSTYMAGELRRYWAFAATLAAGTGAGPRIRPSSEVASALRARQPCFTLALGRRRAPVSPTSSRHGGRGMSAKTTTAERAGRSIGRRPGLR